MMQHVTTPLLIIGAGAAGYTAAVYAARAGLNPVVVTGDQPGGQMTITTDVENYPGFADVIQGPWLMEQMHAQAEKVGARVIHDTLVSVDFSRHPFACTGGNTYATHAVIIATGAQAKWLDVTGEKEFQGHGVSACATCDGFFFKNQHVAVIGGGNTAVEEALYLTSHAARVTLIHRRDSLRAEKILQDRLFKNKKVTVLWDTVVHEMLGTMPVPGVTHLALENIKDKSRRNLAVDGVFVAIGHQPATALFKGVLDMDENGYLLHQPGSSKTAVPGVFVAGDVCDPVYRQAVTAAGMGCMAALDAGRFLAEKD